MKKTRQTIQPEKTLSVVEPEMELERFGEQKVNILQLVKKQMKLNQDYGVIPGTQGKTLYQPGAEKLAKFFGLTPIYRLVDKVEMFEKGFVYYRYECKLRHFSSGKIVGTVQRSCNSKERKYLKQSVFDLVNTCQAMAQKRALVAAVRTATMASDVFVDDIGENEGGESVTLQDDPGRVKLMRKLHAVAKPRGFDDDTLHLIVEKMYGFDSRKDMSDKQIANLIEKMERNFAILEEGETKPRRI